MNTPRIILLSLLVLHGLVHTSLAVTLDHALTVQGSLSSQGSSRLELRWGSVLASSDITLHGFDPLDTTNKTLTTSFNRGRGAGLPYSDSLPGTEQWLRYFTSGTLYVDPLPGSDPLFPAAGIDGVPVVDFFSQIMSGEFPGWNSLNVNLAGDYASAGTTVAGGEGLLYDSPYTTGTGALVQNWAPAVAQVDQITQDFSYATWKQKAIDRYGYLRPKVGGGFVDIHGETLYVNTDGELTTWTLGTLPLTSLKRISMRRWLPASGLTNGIPDRILFIDTYEGTENGTRANISISGSDNFFWKGLLYLNCNFETAGVSAAQIVLGKNPSQYAADPTGLATGDAISNCYLDGIMVTRGTLNRIGLGVVYGAVVSFYSQFYTGIPQIYYNSRLKNGIFPTSYTGVFSTAQTGNWFDASTWQNGQVPPEGSAVVINLNHTINASGPIMNLASLTNHGLLQLNSEHLYLYGGELVNHGMIQTAGGGQIIFGNGGTFESKGTLYFEEPAEPIVFGIGTSTTLALYESGPAIISGDVTIPNLRLHYAPLQCGAADLSITDTWQIDGNYSVSASPRNLNTLRYSHGSHVTGPEWLPSNSVIGFEDADNPDNVIIDEATDVLLIPIADGGVPYSIENLTIEGIDSALSVQGNLLINSTLQNNGVLDQVATDTYYEPFTIINTGLIRCTSSIGFGPYYYGATGVKMELTALGTATTFVVERRDTDPPNAPAGLLTGRYWNITADGTGYSQHLTLPHAATDPYVCRYTGTGESWTYARSSYDTSTVTLNDVTQFSTWAVGDAALGPVPVTLSNFTLD